MPAIPRSSRRHRLLIGCSIVVSAAVSVQAIAGCGSADTPSSSPTAQNSTPDLRLQQLEQAHHARLGLYALDTATGRSISYRADEHFAMESTFKGIACGELLKEYPLSTGYFDQVIKYTPQDVTDSGYAREAAEHVDAGMTVAQLRAAAIELSDNVAANQILKLLGGPAGWTAKVRALGDSVSRLDRWEPQLNTAVPGDLRDTSSPAAEAADYSALVVGTALPPPERALLTAWLLGNKRGAQRFRAGVPDGWTVADKTGTGGRGQYGTANDIGVMWPPNGAKPVVLAILTTHATSNAEIDNNLIAEATRIVTQELR